MNAQAQHIIARLAIILSCWTAPHLRAQEQSQQHSTLSLLDAVGITLLRDPVIQIQELEVKIAEGRLREETGQFDFALASALITEWRQFAQPQASIVNTPAGSQTSSSLTRVANHQTTYRLGLDKPLRSGIVVGPGVEVTRADDNISVVDPQNRAEVNFTVLVPLARGLGPRAATAEERAARIDQQAAQSELEHTVALRLLNTTSSYWNYRAAFERLEVLRESEGRSQELLENTRKLVEAEEVPGAELDQLQANLRDKSRARVAADQNLFESRQTLGLAMGLAFEDIGRLPPAGDAFPDASSGDLSIDRLFAVALQNRNDLRSARLAEASAETLLYLARNQLKPQIDLTLRVGYEGFDDGGQFRNWFTPLAENVKGANGLAAVSFNWPPQNNAARGRLTQQQSVHQQRLIRSADLARTVQSGVLVALQRVRSVVNQLQQATASEESYAKAVTNEREKRRLGLATFTDVLIVQDRLLSASLDRLLAQQDYADALVRLRFEVGLLLGGDSTGRSVGMSELTTLPNLP